MPEYEVPDEYNEPQADQYAEWGTYNYLLDQLSNVLWAEKNATDPVDWQARKASLLKQLDELVLDEQHRQQKLTANLEKAQVDFVTTSAELKKKPKDILAKVRHDIATDELHRAALMHNINEALHDAQKKGELLFEELGGNDSGFTEAEVLEDMEIQGKRLDSIRESQIDDQERAIGDLANDIMTVHFFIDQVKHYVNELSKPEHRSVWDSIADDVQTRRSMIHGKVSDLQTRLGISSSMDQTRFSALLETLGVKSANDITLGMLEAKDVLNDLLEVDRLLTGALKKKAGQ